MKTILGPRRNAAALALAILLGCFISSLEVNAVSAIKLDGRWHFELDPQNAGITLRWFERALSGKVKLPGSLPAQGIGEDFTLETRWVGDVIDSKWFTRPEYAPYTNANAFKFPFWLQPEKYYAGAAWYQREIDIPDDWRGKRLMLSLERPHWETRVWIDGREIGSNRSLFTPHQYDFSLGIEPGKHQLTIRVDNSVVVDVGVNSHCISDHTQGNWNGIVGNITLSATTPVWVEDLQAYPHLAKQSVTIRGRIGNARGQAGKGSLLVRVNEAVERGALMPGPETKTLEVSWQTNGGSFELDVPVPTPKPWDEFHQNLYNASVQFADSQEAKVVSFGFRDVATAGTQFMINGRKAFLRGTLECCIFPKTGHPPTDTASWVRIMKAAKAHGLNHLRFHSYCPPEAAFFAADQEGVYLQVETCWANSSTTLGDGKPVDQWVYDETERILKAYGNHPSFLLMLYGNEPGGDNANAYLAKYVEHFKARDPRRLWSSGSGWPQLPENQFHVTPTRGFRLGAEV
jgi:beta-galactosidase/beta-glucuronidase